jgi:hypothetical protein
MGDTNRDNAISNGAIGNSAADMQAVAGAARQVGDRAMQAGTEAVQHAKSVIGEAGGRASSLLGAAGEKTSSAAEAQKQNVAGYLQDIAGAVHRSGEQLEGHQDWIAKMVERGADELGSLASTLRTNDLQSLLGDLSSLARRQPALFVGASMAAGFALSRVGRLAMADTTSASSPGSTVSDKAAASPQTSADAASRLTPDAMDYTSNPSEGFSSGHAGGGPAGGGPAGGGPAGGGLGGNP